MMMTTTTMTWATCFCPNFFWRARVLETFWTTRTHAMAQSQFSFSYEGRLIPPNGDYFSVDGVRKRQQHTATKYDDWRLEPFRVGLSSRSDVKIFAKKLLKSPRDGGTAATGVYGIRNKDSQVSTDLQSPEASSPATKQAARWRRRPRRPSKVDNFATQFDGLVSGRQPSNAWPRHVSKVEKASLLPRGCNQNSELGISRLLLPGQNVHPVVWILISGRVKNIFLFIQNSGIQDFQTSLGRWLSIFWSLLHHRGTFRAGRSFRWGRRGAFTTSPHPTWDRQSHCSVQKFFGIVQVIPHDIINIVSAIGRTASSSKVVTTSSSSTSA